MVLGNQKITWYSGRRYGPNAARYIAPKLGLEKLDEKTIANNFTHNTVDTLRHSYLEAEKHEGFREAGETLYNVRRAAKLFGANSKERHFDKKKMTNLLEVSF